jgi:hypothetical protein
MTTTYERLEQIELERNEVMGSVEFSEWCKELGVSSSYCNREGIYRANEMMGSYDFGKKIEINLVDSENSRIFTK